MTTELHKPMYLSNLYHRMIFKNTDVMIISHCNHSKDLLMFKMTSNLKLCIQLAAKPILH